MDNVEKIAEQDRRLLEQLQQLHNALAAGQGVFKRPAFVSTAQEVCQSVEQARVALMHATSEMAIDKVENAVVAQEFAQASAAAAEEFRWVEEELRAALLHLKPAELRRLGLEEVGRREMLIRACFPPEIWSTAGLSMAEICRAMDGALERLEASDEVAQSLLGDLQQAVDRVDEAHKAVVAESLDDQPLMDALRLARARAAQTRAGARSIISGMLRLEQAGVSTDGFIKRFGA